MSNLLSVEKLTMKFGGLIAIDDLTFDAKTFTLCIFNLFLFEFSTSFILSIQIF